MKEILNQIIFLREAQNKLNPICHGLLGPDRFPAQFRLLEKGVLELCWAATINPRKIDCSGFFLLDHNGSLRKVKKFNGMFPNKKNRNRKTNLIRAL